jgi:hypothetical protein
MPDLLIPRGCYSRANGDFPPFLLVNMFLEATPAARGGFSHLSFPGLLTSVSRGAGPINGVYRRDDLFGGVIFCVSAAGALYKDGTLLGVINGTGPVSWASSDLELVVTRGQSAYSYNGTNLQAIAFPDVADVTAVTFIAGLFVFARANSRKFYWSAVLDARTIDALDFASAESSPSYLIDVLAIGDVLYLGCKDKIEAWVPTGDGTLPFQKISMRTAAKGVIATGCMVELDNALHFVGNDRGVYRMADVPSKISHPGIDEQLAASTSFGLFSYLHQGHAFLNVRLDTQTLGFDASMANPEIWHERRTWGVSNWVAQCATMQADGTPLFGSATGPELLVYSGWAEGASPLSREFTAAVPATRSFPLGTVELDANPGAADISVSDPKIEMRSSRDGGKTWGPFRAARLGTQGKYRTRPKWRRNGSFDAPGALLHFRVTDPVPFRVSAAPEAENGAGRARE